MIDEAHCFSSWGQDFRVDYLYIAEFINNLKKKKNLEEVIPVSCFTATAKQNVVDDIIKYFKDQLDIELELFSASSSRKNLNYKVFNTTDDEKYQKIRDLLESKKCPTIIYVSRTKRAEELSNRLNSDGYLAKAFQGKMDKNEKSENQDAFIRGDVNIMVATSAFGMGVDKKDVGMVIHYNISDSLENYVQEAGRAGRDQKIQADCYVLFNEEDLNKHFMMLNQTKITLQEIQQVWKAIKNTTRTRSKISNSALEIAREAGWDDHVSDIETRVKTAIAALENAGYIKRGQNNPRVFADSILARNVIEANEKIEKSQLFNCEEETKAKRIIMKLISSRSRKLASYEIPESRIDYISDDLGIEKNEVIHIIQKLREAKVLADAKDLTAYMDESGTKPMNTLNSYKEYEKFLLSEIPLEKSTINIKEMNEKAEKQGIKKINPDKIKKIINYWSIKKIIKLDTISSSNHFLKVNLLKDINEIFLEIQKRWDVAEFILEYIDQINKNQEKEIHFSVLELKEEFDIRMQLLMKTTTTSEVEDALYYLSRIGALKLEGGFLVTYNALSIERIEKDNKIRYKVEDYKNLKRYYDQKTQMIHIVGEYAAKMMENYQQALQFVEDYFQLEYSSFIRKYFKGSRGDEILKNLTPEKFKKLFGELSVDQLRIINDKNSQHIVVAAGPGSGKTRLLVHKLAALLLMEDIKQEQLLMLTFSRAAATEFKKRLVDLIGTPAYYVDIKTFHSYCFDLLGRVGSIDKSREVVKEAVLRIENGEVESSRITKTVLVIDEAQDMDEYEYRLIKALIDKNDDLRVIAVGDDDQNIYSFRGSNSKYMLGLLNSNNAIKYELVKNYRSKANLVNFTNVFVETIFPRMKEMPIISHKEDNGRIEIIQYDCDQLITPAVSKMLTKGIKGSTCVLTKTNEEALQIAALLQKNGIRAKLIQSNDSFSLYNLVEIRYIISELNLSNDTYIIPDENWDEAKRKFKYKYSESENYSLCEQILKDFEKINPKYKYKTDFEIFLYESKEEDFYDLDQGYTIVSTIHKSKGWEFDHIILILDHFYINQSDSKRQLYVGMTRAKDSLMIHYNESYFDNERYRMIDQLIYKTDHTAYQFADFILLQLRYKDVYLSYFNFTQDLVKQLKSGDILRVNEYGCFDYRNNLLLKFSNKFKEELKKHQQKGYILRNAKVKYCVYWKEENAENEIVIILPEIELFRSGSQ